MAWTSPREGVRFKTYKQADQQLRLVEFTKEFIELDWCQKAHTGYVLEGEMVIDFNGKLTPFKAGDALIIPQGDEHKHKAHVTSERVMLFLAEQSNED